MKIAATCFSVAATATMAFSAAAPQDGGASNFRKLSLGNVGSNMEVFGPSHGSENSDFGRTVVWTGSNLIVGAPLYGDGNNGSVFVFDQDSGLRWSLAGRSGEQIGDRLAVSRDRLVVRRSEHVEVYDMATNTLVGKPVESEGSMVNLVENLLVVSEETVDTFVGRVRLLALNNTTGNWTETLSIPGFAPNGRFGWATSLSDDGNRLAISAPNAELTGQTRKGMVLVLEKDSSGQWNHLGQILLGSHENEQFGFSMAMSGDGSTIVVGSPGFADLRGRLSVFRLASGNWIQIGSDVLGHALNDRFGRSATANYNGDRIAGSSFFHNSQRGQVQVLDYVDGDWSLVTEIEGNHALDRLGFGVFSLSMVSDGTSVAAGAVWADNTMGVQTGNVVIQPLSALSDAPLAPSSAPSQTHSYVPSASPSSNEDVTGGVPYVLDVSLEHTFRDTSATASQPSEFGSVVSLRGDRLFIGAPQHVDETSTGSGANGAIVLYDLQSSQMIWSLSGQPGDEIGARLSVSADGSLVALRTQGSVEVHNVGGNGFSEIVGSAIITQGDGDTITLSPDGAILAVSEESFDHNTGRVKLYKLATNSNWIEAAAFVGDVGQSRLFGWITAFSDSGTRFAVSSPNHSTEGAALRGLVRVFEWDGSTWNRLGGDLLGINGGDQFGFSMAMSGDGQRLVVGAPGSNGGGTFRGEVSIFSLIGSQWVQTGNTIAGGMDRDRFGRSVVISRNGNRIAASSFIRNAQQGQIRVLDYTSDGYWVEVLALAGEERGERLGFGILGLSLSPGGDEFAAGATLASDANPPSSGRVDLFRFTMPNIGAIESMVPSVVPTITPSRSSLPSAYPTTPIVVEVGALPTALPSTSPSGMPSNLVSNNPSIRPSVTNSPPNAAFKVPSNMPTNLRTMSLACHGASFSMLVALATFAVAFSLC